jgi:hypothetical protein
MRPSSAHHHDAISKNRLAPGKLRVAKRRKAHANHCRVCADTCAQTCATRLLRGGAPFSEARPPSGACTAALVRNRDVSDSVPGHASWDVDTCVIRKSGYRFSDKDHAPLKEPAGVTRRILSQSSDSTSRLGRNTEGTDAQNRPGAGCKPARRHRTRSASESTLAKVSLDEGDSLSAVTETETFVKTHRIARSHADYSN